MSGAVSVLDAAKAHFQQKVAAGLKSVPVPEWGDGVVVYYGPETGDARDKYFKECSQGGFSGFVKVVLYRARDQHGKPLFGEADFTTLMRSVDPAVITKIAVAILGDTAGESVAEVGKS